MSRNALLVEDLKEVFCQPETGTARAVNGEANCVHARVEDSVSTGAVVLKLQQIVSVIKCENVLCFAGVYQFHGRKCCPYLGIILWRHNHLVRENGTKEEGGS